jgi:hypothetical protein
MLSKISFLINLLYASVGIGAVLMMVGATSVGGFVMFGGGLVALMGLMFVN